MNGGAANTVKNHLSICHDDVYFRGILLTNQAFLELFQMYYTQTSRFPCDNAIIVAQTALLFNNRLQVIYKYCTKLDESQFLLNSQSFKHNAQFEFLAVMAAVCHKHSLRSKSTLFLPTSTHVQECLEE
jgi:hypothetical protein